MIMKTLKKYLKYIFTCFFVSLFMMSCSVEKYESMYNDDNKIIHGVASYSQIMASNTKKQTNSSISLISECKKMSGVNKCFSINVTSNSKANIDFTVYDGKMKIVLVDSNNLYLITEGSYSGTYYFSNIPFGTYKFTLVGVEAQYYLNFNYTY